MAAERKRAIAVPIAPPERVRCAVYTRKSTEDGLEQDFNSLDAQREAAESFINSQRHEGWITVPGRYDDGGYSGANLERPALKRLLADIEAGVINCVVVYKVDRLTRSIHDFFKILEIFEKQHVSIVSVTQQFNTTTSMGRLALTILLTFAQFEREMISERTRDKMCAARRKGKWIGGNILLGYDLAERGGALVVNNAEAERVRDIFRLYLEHGTLLAVVRELERRGWRMKAWTSRRGRNVGGGPFTNSKLHNLLTNVTYTGRIKFQGQLLAGEHERIVDDETWNAVQERLNRNGRLGGRNVPNKYGALLKGLVVCERCGVGMIHTYVRKRETVIYRYYVCANAHQNGWNRCDTRSVSAPLLEGAVLRRIRGFACQPGIVREVMLLTQTHRQQRRSLQQPATDSQDVEDLLMKFDPLWDQLNTREQEQYIRALVKEVRYDGTSGAVTIGFRSDAIKRLCQSTGAHDE